MLISTHLIREIENIFDEVIFLKDGEIVLYENVEEFRFPKRESSYMNCLRRCLVNEVSFLYLYNVNKKKYIIYFVIYYSFIEASFFQI